MNVRPHFSKKKLLRVAHLVLKGKRLTPEEISYLNSFIHSNEEHPLITHLKNAAFPLAVVCGAILAANSSYFDAQFSQLPTWTNLNPIWLAGFDYAWSIIGSPVGKPNILYHLPNIVLYSAGFISIQTILESIKKRNWVDIVLDAQTKMRLHLEAGTLSYQLAKGHSILFVGAGDFIAMQYTLDQAPEACITLASVKPTYSSVWSKYLSESHESDLQNSLQKAETKDAGEYLFFPVQDTHIFLPAPTAYDMAPHRIDLHCQNIRKLEKLNGWEQNPIFIVGDRYHQSIVQTENKSELIAGSEEVISMESIAKRYPYVFIVDPTEIVLRHILTMARKRRIVFRATIEGLAEYKKRFYQRLELLGYDDRPAAKGVFIVGYDLFEDQIEQQKLCGKLDDYYPVVLSKNVYDALLANGHKMNELIYVPDLVIAELLKLADRQ